jgi:hypothetical protein
LDGWQKALIGVVDRGSGRLAQQFVSALRARPSTKLHSNTTDERRSRRSRAGMSKPASLRLPTATLAC